MTQKLLNINFPGGRLNTSDSCVKELCIMSLYGRSISLPNHLKPH